MTDRTTVATPVYPEMPDFVATRRGVRQTMQAALKSLFVLGVDADRIRIRRVGRGWPRQAVVSQTPPPGTSLTDTVRVTLDISAASAVDALPFAMRDDVEGAMGTVGLMPILDTPIAKLEAFVTDAGGFFELRPERPATAWRWIRELFALDPHALSDDLAFRLARFLPALHRLAGTEHGLAIGLAVLCDLPLHTFALVPAVVPRADRGTTRLGEANARLGVDAVIGRGVTALARAVVTLGPLSLDAYVAADTAEGRRRREMLYDLVMPTAVLRPVEECWHVEAPAGGPRLGAPEAPLRLGLNARLERVTSHGS